MARNEVPLTLSSNKDILRPLYICKTNLFWSVIKTSLQQQLPVLLVGTQLHAKLPLSVRIANLFLVKCGWYGLPPPRPRLTIYLLFFTKSISLASCPLLFSSVEVSDHFIRHPFTLQHQKGRGEKGKNVMTSSPLKFFIPFLPVLCTK